MTISRRYFLKGAGGAAVALAGGATSFATSPSSAPLPFGLELYTVDNAMKADFAGTLREVAAIGYREVEFPWYHGHSAADVSKALRAAGLRCRSGLVTTEELDADAAARIGFAGELGLTYLGCVMMPLPEAPDVRQAVDRLTLDHFRRFAEKLNRYGEQARKAGLQLTYHNHDFEFKKFGNILAYDELLRLMDPQLVKMEMDVGWVVRAGHDPVRYLREHPGRFSLLHIRDLKTDMPPQPLEMHSVEIGRGVIDWKEVLRVARTSGVVAGFVEQDPGTVPVSLASAKVSFEYLNGLRY